MPGVIMILISLSMFFFIIRGLFRRADNKTDTTNYNHTNNSILVSFNQDISKDVSDYSFLMSQDRKELAIRYNGENFKFAPQIINIKDIVKLEIYQNNQLVKSSGLGRALVGGVLAGGVGAIVGSNTAKQKEVIESIGIKITTNDISNPLIKIQLYGANEQFKGASPGSPYSPNVIEEKLEELISILEIIKNS